MDDKVIGFILGNAKKDKNHISNCGNPLNFNNNEIDLMISNEENKNLLKEFSKFTDTYKELIKKKENTFQSCIQLFVVSRESRGLGVGKNLIKYLFDYMKSMDVKSLYLFTDTRCNYGFYDSPKTNIHIYSKCISCIHYNIFYVILISFKSISYFIIHFIN